MLSCFSLLAYAAKVYLTDPSYYKYGYFRADAVPQLAAGTPVFKGSANCRECHEERNSDWSVDVHKTVQCEVCHGTREECPDKENPRVPADTIRLCTTCHEAMPARPAGQPQIVVAEHPVADGEIMQCIECHDPHTPGPVVREEEAPVTEPPVAVAAELGVAMPPEAKKCGKCHGRQGEGVKKNPALAGMESADFISQMQMYRSGEGDSKAMIRFAKSLSDEEISILAEYYESLPKKSPE